MMKEEILSELKYHYKYNLSNAFPFEDVRRMKLELRMGFVSHSLEEDFNADLDHFCMMIAGTISYLLNNNAESVPRNHIDFLKKGFFEHFPQYRFVEAVLDRYPKLNLEFTSFERARNLALAYLGKC